MILAWTALSLAAVAAPDAEPTPAELVEQADTLIEARDFVAAEAVCRRLLAQVGEEGPPAAERGIALACIGYTMAEAGDPRGGEAWVTRAMQEPLPGRDDLHRADMHHRAGLAFSEIDADAAEAHMREALAIREAVLGPEHDRVATSLNNLGNFLADRGRPEEARALLVRALGLWEQIAGPDHEQVAVALANLAGVYNRTGEDDKARDAYRRSLHILEGIASTDAITLAAARNNYGLFLKNQGQLAEARGLMEQALEGIAAVLGPDHPNVGKLHHNLGTLLRVQGDLAAARTEYTRALAVFDQAYGHDSRGVALTLTKLAAIERAQGRPEEAVRMLREAIDILEGIEPDGAALAMPFGDLAKVLAEQGDLDGAWAANERAMALSLARGGPEQSDIVLVLQGRARIAHYRGDDVAAVATLEEAKALADRIVPPGQIVRVGTEIDLAEAYHRVGRVDEARATIDRAFEDTSAVVHQRLDGLSEREQLALLAQAREVLDTLLVVYADPADARHAYQAVLSWKGAARRALIARRQRLRRSDDPEVAALESRLTRLRSQVADRALGGGDETELVTLLEDKERVERKLAAASLAWAGELDAAPTGLEAVCDALPRRAVLVDFVRRRSGFTAFVVTEDCTLSQVALGASEEVEAAVRHHHDLLASRAEIGRVRRAGAAVRERVWDPLPDVVHDAPVVVLSADGALSLVPFAALPTDEAHYLVETHTLAVVDSATDLAQWARTPLADGAGALLVGDVDLAGSGGGTERAMPCIGGAASPLPGTGDEVRLIASRLADRGVASTVLTGSEPTERRVTEESSGRRILHLATHGFFADGSCVTGPSGMRDGARDLSGSNPMMLSALVLAADAEARRDGVWTAEEVASLDLAAAELVVLSACETGLGAMAAGEGVVGLRRAMSVAGARSLILSLWPVDDAATRDLMSLTYTDLLRRKARAPVQALRRAQLDMLQAQRRAGEDEPWLWGAFVATGPSGGPRRSR